MAVLPSWLVGFGPSINAGGPSSLFWGWIVVFPFVCCIALGMAEFASAYPVEGGSFTWSLRLSNKKWGPFMSYITGYVHLTANTLNYTQITSQRVNVGICCVVLIFATLFCLLGTRYSKYMSIVLVFWIGIGTIIILVSVPALAPKHNTAKWVFTEFTNNTGYESMVLVFFVGMNQAGWTLIGYDCGIQIVEGTRKASVAAPRGILITVVTAILQGFVTILVVLFSIQNMEEIIESPMPLATFLIQATRNPQLTAFLLFILLVAQFAGVCNAMTSLSHFIFALARDNCLPFAKHLSTLSHKNHVPQIALIVQLVVCILLILPAFGSTIYWQAVMSASIICVNVSYGIPFLCRLIWVRNDMPKGPFDLGRFGLPLNLISVVWITFFSVILCIPPFSPITPENFNWSPVMIGGVMIFSLLFWLVSGRFNYKGTNVNTVVNTVIEQSQVSRS
ncbi:unnamed protein product [Mucor hiemalis]